ncbi:PAS domain S-box protein [Flectobacillus major]|uniref:PAS domain S-box protein n=1 Tax=Flectobacillus major TaxID=103 RepID=UPI00042266AF|nr:PAS domain S-box protein [Flectobacillus major]
MKTENEFNEFYKPAPVHSEALIPNTLFSALDHISEGVIMVDTTWKVIYINLKIQVLFKKNISVNLYHNFWFFFPELALPAFSQACKQAMNQKVARELQVFVEHFTIWISCKIIPSDTGITIIINDITSQKEGFHKEVYYKTIIETNEQLYKSLFDNNPDAVCTVDLQGNFLIINNSLAQILENTPENLIGQPYLKYIHPDDQAISTKCFQDALEGKLARGIVRGISTKGNIFAIDNTKTPIVINQQIIGVYCISKNITSTIEIEKSLISKQSELQRFMYDFNHLMNSSLDIICTLSIDTSILKISIAAEKIWGYPIAVLQQKKITDLVAPKAQDMVLDYFQKLSNGNPIELLEVTMINQEGKGVPMVWSANWDAQQKTFYAVARDVTEKKRDEYALILSEQKYEYIFNINPLPMWISDFETKQFIEINEAAIQHYGYTKEEMLMMKEYEIVHPDSLALWQNIPYNYQTTPTSFQGVISHIKKNGDLTISEITVHLVEYHNRSVSLVLVNDITQKRQDEQEIIQTNSRLKTAQEIAHLGYWERDLESDFIYWSDEVYKIFEITHSPETFTYDTFIQMVHPDDRTAIQLLEFSVLYGNNPVEKAFRVMLPNGKTKHLFSKTQVIFDTFGNPSRIDSTIQDITERKKSEEEREILIRELTQNNKDLRQFSYITSHNMRSPLSNLVGLLKLLDTSTITDPTTLMILEGFRISTHQLNDTINDLIKILIIKENVNVHKEDILFEEIWHKITQMTYQLIAEAQANINIDFEKAPIVSFNATYLESILLNLLSNSLKYRAKDRPLSIWLSTEKRDNCIILYFSDNGLGIDLKRHRNKVFGLYQRFHDHPDSKGIGLYMVDAQIKSLGGNIEIDSYTDRGTTFTLTFKI